MQKTPADNPAAIAHEQCIVFNKVLIGRMDSLQRKEQWTGEQERAPTRLEVTICDICSQDCPNPKKQPSPVCEECDPFSWAVPKAIACSTSNKDTAIARVQLMNEWVC